jgi:dolichol kinase
VVIAFLGAVFEMLSLRIDDNLTIPLFVGFAGWAVFALLGIPLA